MLGFQEAPEAGDRMAVVESEARAREVADYRARQKREKALARTTAARGSLEQMMSQLQSAGQKIFPLVIKADVQGSVEAITQALASEVRYTSREVSKGLLEMFDGSVFHTVFAAEQFPLPPA